MGVDRSFTDRQVRRGLALLGAFVVLRAVLWGPLWSQPTPADPLRFAALLAVTVLAGSVGLVSLGFSHWVGVDLLDWWVDRDDLRGDLLWGVAGFAVALAATVGTALVVQATLGPLPAAAPVGAAPSPLGTALLLVFGFAVAAFQEETLFRGFLQSLLAERAGDRAAVVGQAVAFSVAHVGFYPLSAWYLFVTAFAAGLVYGWLRRRRNRLLAPGVAHGLLG